MLDIVDDQPSPTRPTQGLVAGEFYYFKNPEHKVEALAGILQQKPLEIEERFNSIADNESKISFLNELMPTINRENILIFEELILDTRRDIAIKIKQGEHLEDQFSEINKLIGECAEIKRQFRFIDEIKNQIELIKTVGKEKIRGTSVNYILENINQEFSENQNMPDSYRNQLIVLAEEVKNL